MTFPQESDSLLHPKKPQVRTPLPPPIPQHIVAEIESESFFTPRYNLYMAISTAMFGASLVFLTLIWLKI